MTQQQKKYISLFDAPDDEYGPLNPLQQASLAGDFAKVEQLLLNDQQQRDNISEMNYHRYDAILLASEQANWDIVKLLIQNGARLDNWTTSYHHINALYYAVEMSQYELVDLILTTCNERHNNDNTHISASNLLNTTYDPTRHYPIHRAILQNDEKMVELLLKYGANPSISRAPQDVYNNITNDDSFDVQLWIKKLQNAEQDSALEMALMAGNHNILKILQNNALPSGKGDRTYALSSIVQCSKNIPASFAVAFQLKNSDGSSYYPEIAYSRALIALLFIDFTSSLNAFALLLQHIQLNNLNSFNLNVILSEYEIKQLLDSTSSSSPSNNSSGVSKQQEILADRPLTPLACAMITNNVHYITMFQSFSNDDTKISSAKISQDVSQVVRT